LNALSHSRHESAHSDIQKWGTGNPSELDPILVEVIQSALHVHSTFLDISRSHTAGYLFLIECLSCVVLKSQLEEHLQAAPADNPDVAEHPA
jgi:hypothetical protein